MGVEAELACPGLPVLSRRRGGAQRNEVLSLAHAFRSLDSQLAPPHNCQWLSFQSP